jgi:tetratricopeptide (TPR) repeat protein
MRRKFEELRENLDEFVEQDAYPMLVVGCLPEELAYLCKFLQSLEQKFPQHFFVLFPQAFDSPSAYLDGVVESIRLQVEAAQSARTERGDLPFPPMPAPLFDGRRVPEERLYDVLRYLESLLPNEQDHRVVVGFLPLTCNDPIAFARLVGSIVPIDTIEPWMGALRIVVYDDRLKKLLVNAMHEHRVKHVLTFQVDFSTSALTNALGRDAGDPALSTPERMSSLLQLAALDCAYKRYPEALEKYGVLYKYYAEQSIPAMQGLCLLGAGDTLRASGHLAEAKEYLQRGIALTLENKVLPALLNLLISITDTTLELQQGSEAESYAESGAQVAAATLNPFAYADLHEKKGDAQVAQNKIKAAIATYRRCAQLCQTYGYFHRWKSVLQREHALYSTHDMRRERSEVENEIEHVARLEETPPAQSTMAPAAHPGQQVAGAAPT